MSTEGFRCPRRSEAPYQIVPGPDRWLPGASLARGIGPCCSYCGSLQPEVFLGKLREGWIVGPTDKSYKAYVLQPYTPEELKQRKTSSPEWRTARRQALDTGLSEAEATAAADQYWSRYHELGEKGRMVAKFYYQHLADGQRHAFIELYNTRAMQIGYPGHFYVAPFFCRPVDQDPFVYETPQEPR